MRIKHSASKKRTSMASAAPSTSTPTKATSGSSKRRKSDAATEGKRKYRHKPGTVALMEIRNYPSMSHLSSSASKQQRRESL